MILAPSILSADFGRLAEEVAGAERGGADVHLMIENADRYVDAFTEAGAAWVSFGGQAFLPASLDKVGRLRQILKARGLSAQIEVDGGVDATNARALVEAGAEVLVAGSAVFGQGDPEASPRRLIEACT